MKIRTVLIFLSLYFLACKSKEDTGEQKFDKSKWAMKDEKGYLYRDKMLNDFITNYKMNGVKGDSILTLLGQPDRTDNGHLFYTISQDFLGGLPVPMHTKTLVIKLTKDSTVEWRKIHQ